MFDNAMWGLECIKEFSPYLTNGDKKLESRFIVKLGERLRVHDKAVDMWEVSYTNGRLFWTDLNLLIESCVSISSKAVY